MKLDDVGEQLEKAATKRHDDDTEATLEWISSMRFWTKQADVFESVQPGTGQWLLEDARFAQWVEGDLHILWCPGKRKQRDVRSWYATEIKHC